MKLALGAESLATPPIRSSVWSGISVPQRDAVVKSNKPLLTLTLST